MQRIVIILLMLFYGTGTLLLPMGDFMSGINLHDMYLNCSKEDPDITPADFVFEHMLNLEDVMQYFEGEKGTEEGERPHEPSVYMQPAPLFVVEVSRPVYIQTHPYSLMPADKIVYPLVNEDLHSSQYLSDILRPPIV